MNLWQQKIGKLSKLLYRTAGKNLANLGDHEEKKNFGIMIIVPLLLLHLPQHTCLLRTFEWKLNSSTPYAGVASSCQPWNIMKDIVQINCFFSFKLSFRTGNSGGFLSSQRKYYNNLQLSFHICAVMTTNFRHLYIWIEYSIARIVTYITSEHTPVYI